MNDSSSALVQGHTVQRTASHTEVVDEPRPITADESRPNLSKQWQTERPKVTTKSSFPSFRIKRGLTNTSALNNAIWNAPTRPLDEEDSSSSSSSSDEEEPIRSRHGSKGSYSKFNVGNDNYKTRGKVSKRDGRLNISVNETNNRGYLAKALGASFLKPLVTGEDGPAPTPSKEHRKTLSRTSTESTVGSNLPQPRLNIVVMVIGSRGDIQPFLKLGKDLKEYGHRVRIATHPAFKEFVEEDSGLEFFSCGGDPSELMAFMVKNPGMIPTMETIKKGEIGRRREQMAEMFDGFWRACINATDDEKDVSNMRMMADKNPFVADAIIANPPCFAHIHCAERLGIPLHLMFTFPYTPTQAFPHPLANIKKTNVDPGYTNFMSYPLVEMMTWQGLGDLVNSFRVKTLGLEPVSTLWAPGQLYRLKVPYTYLWSPGLVPKPEDWGPEIDIAGFVFLDLASSFEPPDELQEFLKAGEPPVYIGFGSIVVDDPDRFTKMIFEAVEMAGVRALVSKGWGGLGEDNVPDSIYMLENTPHDWLFPKVKAVVHHGGAGTTAIGLKCGKPAMVVPFFGDQPFWGAMISKSGAGANPVPYKDLTPEKLAEGIRHCLTKEAREAAEKIARDIEAEGDGARNAVKSFHRGLILKGQRSMRCSILEDRVAVWTLKHTNLRLSALAAELLVGKKKISWKQLRLIRHNEWNDFEGPGEPVTGVAHAVKGTVTGIAGGVGSVPFKLAKSSKRRAQHEERKKRVEGKRSGSGSGTLSNCCMPNSKIPNGKPVEAQTNGIKKKEQPSKMNGNEPDKIHSEKAPRDKRGTATSGNDLGKHTSTGEPFPPADEHAGTADIDSLLSDDPEENVVEEVAMDVGAGLGESAEAFARAPMDLSLAVAQGFHNAPRLYGDTTVRRPTRITGMKSGLKAAGEEFVFGIYDGVTGLVVQPYTGARDQGAVGFMKGVGMGLTGFVLKDLAAIIGPFGYTMKGIQRELLKNQQPTHFIRKARILQGQRDLRGESDEQNRKDNEAVDHGWSVVQQVWEMLEERKAHGLKGRIQLFRERKTWRANGAFENVEMAERALEARRKGESLDDVFEEQKAHLEKADKPRKDAVDDIGEGKENKNRGGKHTGPGED